MLQEVLIGSVRVYKNYLRIICKFIEILLMQDGYRNARILTKMTVIAKIDIEVSVSIEYM